MAGDEDVKVMWYTMYEGYKAWRTLKSVLSNKELDINDNKCTYGVIVPTALYEAEACDLRTERRKVNMLEMKCSKCLV